MAARKKTAAKKSSKKKASRSRPATTGGGVAMPQPTAAERAESRKWQARQDLETLQRAEEIKGDRQRVSAVKREATAQQKALAKATKGVR